jgi:hypothetical protein
MVEFALNSAISSSTGFAPFELNCGYMPIVNPGITPTPSSLPGIKHFVMHTLQNLANAHDAIIESWVCQTHYANTHRCEDNSFMVGDLIYVSTADLLLPKGQAMRLLLKYIGLFKVLEAHPNTSSYRVELPTLLHMWNLHDRLHCSKLRHYHVNDNALFPHQEAHMYYNFGTPNNREWLIDEILAHRWDCDKLMFQVNWNIGETT